MLLVLGLLSVEKRWNVVVRIIFIYQVEQLIVKNRSHCECILEKINMIVFMKYESLQNLWVLDSKPLIVF